MRSALASVLSPPDVRRFETAASWWADHLRETRMIERPVDRAIVGATFVDRVGFAFAGGYAAALSSLVPSLPRETLASLAATEDGGGHPRAILTELAKDDRPGGFVLTGKKRWVTLGPEGGVVLVVARRAESKSAERPELIVARVPSDAPGVTITPLAHMPFVPEIPHAELTLERVRVSDDDVLPGDGYERYLKPFRTVEDIHVHAALVAWLATVGARASWPTSIEERLVALLALLRSLASEDPASPLTHVALGGALAEADALLREIEPHWASTDEQTRSLFARDRVLMTVASKARAARLASAWARLRA